MCPCPRPSTHPLSPWTPRERPALASMANGGELGRVLIPSLEPGAAARRGMWPGHDHRRVGRYVGGRTGGRDRRRARRLARSRSGRSSRRRSGQRQVRRRRRLPARFRTAATSTWSTPTRCSSTWPTRGHTHRDEAGVPPRRHRRRSRRGLGGMFWFPRGPRYRGVAGLYRRVARAVGGEPDGGRRIVHWARRAGFTDVEATAGSWCLATPDERAWWGGLWADRLTRSRFAHEAVSSGCASTSDLERLADAWRRWTSNDDGWFVVPHGEVLCRR